MAATWSTKRRSATAASAVANASRAADHGRQAMQSRPKNNTTLGTEFGAVRLSKPHGSLRQPTHTRTHARGDELECYIVPSLSKTPTKDILQASLEATGVCLDNMIMGAFDILSFHLHCNGRATTAPKNTQEAKRKPRDTWTQRLLLQYNRKHKLHP